MKFLVKARGYGTVAVEIEEVTTLTPEVAVMAAEKAILTEFPGATDLTVYEAENVEHGRVINVREVTQLEASLVR